MDNEVMKELKKPFENIKERRGAGGKTFRYIPTEDIYERMHNVFKGNWSTEVISQEVMEDQVLVRVRVMVQDPYNADAKLFWHEGFASHPLFRDGSGKIIDSGNSHSAAMSKAIKQACKKWGVSVDLDESNTPAVESSAPTKPIFPAFDIPVPPVPTPAKETVVEEKPKVVEEKPLEKLGVPAEILANLPPLPKPESKDVSTFGSTKDKIESTAPTMPKFPAQSQPEMTSVNKNVVGISDVQKIAIQGILSLNNAKYEELAAEAFAAKGITTSPIPSVENLTYDEAVVVVKFGNDKYRNKK